MLRLQTDFIDINAEGTEKEKVLEALVNVSMCDLDFIGENGFEYLWEDAEGFESNQDYLIEQIKDMEIDDAVAEFFSRWLGHDCYYEDYEYEIIRDGQDRVVAIAVAYTVDD